MKSWADHCSSDEESDDIPRVSSLGNLQALDDQDSDSDHSDEESEVEQVHVYNFPSSPPYTAFVGNLPFDIQDANHLAFELEAMCERILNTKVKTVNGRLMLDRDTGKKKGFGYVEFDTLEDLKTVMELNNKAELSGRKIRLDVANAPKNSRPNNQNRSRQGRNNYDHPSNHHQNNNNHHQSNALPEIDGSQFQRGRFQRSTSHSSSSTQPSNNHTKLRRFHSSGTSEPPSLSSNMPKSRPTLKLAPRSKPLEPSNSSKSQASIFGGAKPREEHLSNSESNKNTGNGTQPTPTAILKPVRKPATNAGPAPTTANSTAAHITTSASNTVTTTKDGPSPSSSNNHSSSFRRGKDGKDRNNRRGPARSGRGKKKQEDRRGPNAANNKRGGNSSSTRKSSDGWDEAQSKPIKSVVDMQKKNKVVEEPKSKPKPVKNINAFAALGLDDSDSD